MNTPDDDRPWGELSGPEQDTLMEEAGGGVVENIDVTRIPLEQWDDMFGPADPDPDDTYREGVDQPGGDAA